jgi:conjugative relaxase-like TrwC/TraI family protein
MLRINQNMHAAGAKSYYSTADYYTEGQELAGHWRGEGAKRLGLSGVVKQADWDALCDNLHPQTGKPLTLRKNNARTVGYDFNFHVPKSVSLLYAMTRDERILDAFRESVDQTMREMEAEMKTRVRKAGQNEDRTTGNMVWGEFVHFTSRPVDGVPDPHLHAHCFVFNTTFDGQENAWKAGQFRDLKRDAPFFEAMFHARFARKLAELGLPVERKAKGWEIAGVSKGLIDKFSRRTAEIEARAAELGIEDAEAKAELGAKTRDRKVKDLTFPELQAEWRARMTPQELGQLGAVEKRLGGDAIPPDNESARRALDYAVGHAFERKSVVPERQLLTLALKHAVGKAAAEQVLAEAGRHDLIAGDRGGRRMVTTRSVLGEEKQIIQFARAGRGACKKLAARVRRFRREKLNESQKKAIRHILASRDRVILVRGAAGVGKTTLMQEAVEAIEESGTRVFAFAPSAAASRGVQRAEGFKDADTVARLLKDEKLQQQAKGQVLWIDEAGLLGTKTLRDLFALAEKLDARVLLTGDKYQHGSVERGAALRLLEEEAGLKPAEVREIQRQKGQYKAAVKALSEGKVSEGFKTLDGFGWICEVPDAERYKQLAADYVATVGEGKTALVVSPTHLEGNRITGEIRRSLRECGLIGKQEREFRTLENAHLTEAEKTDSVSYLPGDVLQFHQNAKGFKKGQRVTVDEGCLPLGLASRFTVFHASSITIAANDVIRITHNGMTADGEHRLDNGALYRVKGFDPKGNIVLENGWTVAKDFGHFTYGYVVTSHASQGKTVDRVFVGQGSESFPASSREQFYVSVSRAREQVLVYTDDKQSLLDAVSRSDDRVSATELVNGTPQREVVALHRRLAADAPQPQTRKDRGISYER